jgi:diguanylate cyclase (GGDEF)-like protein/PAS domain S-box-containing protein
MGGSTVDDRVRLLESAVVHARDAVVVTDFDASGEPRVVLVNPAFTAQTGYEADEVVGRHPRLLVGPDTDLDAQLALRRAAEERQPVTVELLHYRKDGTTFWVENSINPVTDAAGVCTHLVSIQRDVTDRKAAEDALRRSEARFRLIVQHASDIITVFDRDGGVTYSSPAATRILGYADGFKPQSVLELVHPDDVDAVASALAACMATPGVTDPIRFRMAHADGTWVPVEATANNLLGDPDVGGVVVITRDISERKRVEDELAYQALHDPLTGLPNRTLLADRLDRALSTARRHAHSVGLLLMDLDRFKEINDTLGHKSGDQILEQVARRLQVVLRQSDTVARLGGDEFAIVVPDIDGVEEAELVATKVLEALDHPFELGGLALHVDASVGIAVAPAHGDDAAVLLQRADVAMYRAKGLVSGYAVYSAESDENRLQRLALMAELRAAVDQNQLVLHYQPVVAASTSEVVAVEALVRWRHPQRGLLPPAWFIPLAEQTGLIKPLTLWVLDAALRQVRAWKHEGIHTRVAVNLSARLLHDPDLLAFVTQSLADADLSDDVLDLEVTESAVMVNPQGALDVITDLSRKGVRFTIDDFGTGYSSLGYLKRLPVHQIKIDRSFVVDMLDDESNASIVRSVVELAHSLGVRVVAEGVEDERTLDRLASYGCDYAQGFFLGVPVVPAEITGRLSIPGKGSNDPLTAPIGEPI